MKTICGPFEHSVLETVELLEHGGVEDKQITKICEVWITGAKN